jgi:hypothetical protein
MHPIRLRSGRPGPGALRGHDILIEMHDFPDITISSYLNDLFKDCHRQLLIASVDDLQKARDYQYPELDSLSLPVRRQALAEDRPRVMEWLIVEAKEERKPYGCGVSGSTIQSQIFPARASLLRQTAGSAIDAPSPSSAAEVSRSWAEPLERQHGQNEQIQNCARDQAAEDNNGHRAFDFASGFPAAHCEGK